MSHPTTDNRDQQPANNLTDPKTNQDFNNKKPNISDPQLKEEGIEPEPAVPYIGDHAKRTPPEEITGTDGVFERVIPGDDDDTEKSPDVVPTEDLPESTLDEKGQLPADNHTKREVKA